MSKPIQVVCGIGLCLLGIALALVLLQISAKLDSLPVPTATQPSSVYSTWQFLDALAFIGCLFSLVGGVVVIGHAIISWNDK